MMPEQLTPAMIEAATSQLVVFLDCRPHAARRWIGILYATLVEASEPKKAKPAQNGPRYDWPTEHIRAWLCEAARTLEASDFPRDGYPKALKSWWPPVVRNPNEAYTNEAPRLRPAKPTSQQIDRMDHCLWWIEWLAVKEDRIMVFRRSQGTPWPRLAQADGRSERTLRYRFAAAIEAISVRLTATQPRLGCFMRDPGDE